MTNGPSLSKIERKVIAGILLGVILLVGTDLYTDFNRGGSLTHVNVEFGVALIATLGFFILIRSSFKIIQRDLQQVKNDATKWHQESLKHVEGLSNAIDSQLERWELSPSEKEVALLLLKGLSLKEIAELRNTTEKTARSQSAAVYQKSGLAGRSELSAFFLEDLLTPGHSS